ncbi:guanyl-nucleotide exchange factor [Schizosaccharomyces cryophilus OY26]|uniref:Guanyl-nucleotide exchange factor n=1 Tax=Schizosaccharomyces cryophilus (strain OY26 / ATCC MYA-4695 / CBS 11777 / NBRC 106824 / NRRL Y48691) TaxID=653667 RepID=S9X8V7_SCHCR|nr:guanyl-nucleotide exchange factor [Schizosaccharomyces cryophilus OY26]EPY53627.1 guanyl-nucleotide exchange factor [Schizosaccharomyces cryophilus OY26]
MDVPRAFPNHEPLCSISPSSLVINEIITIVTAIRKTSRWRNSGVASILGVTTLNDEFLADGLENRWKTNGEKSSSVRYPLVMEFSQLKADLTIQQNLSNFDSLRLLSPFLRTIKSPRTTGNVTSLCISAILKLFSLRIITEKSPNLDIAMRNLSFAITQCRFESYDSSQDEVVLLRVSRLMEESVRGAGNRILSDDSICEIVETGLSMCCQMRVSAMLRQSAELSMISIIQCIFERLKYIDPELDDENFWNETLEHPIEEQEFHYNRLNTSQIESSEITPFGIESIREVLRVLISFIDSKNQHFSDQVKSMALRFINAAFEVAGEHMGNFPSLRILISDTLCKSLLQLIRHSQTPVLTNSLIVMTTLLQAMPHHLKLQQELFISYLISCLQIPTQISKDSGLDSSLVRAISSTNLVNDQNPDRATPTSFSERKRFVFDNEGSPPEIRELIVECFGSLSRIPGFLVDLYVNYDCDPQMSDLASDLIRVLTRNCLIDAARYSTNNVPPLCLDTLLNFIHNFHERRLPTFEPKDHDRALEASASLLQSKERKFIIIEGANLFNESPSEGISYLSSHSIIEHPSDPNSIASFFHSTNRLSKRVLGEYLSKASNTEILNAFIDAFDFKGKRIDEALRMLLQSFRLPGESQLIERVVEAFSHYYVEANPGVVASKDAAFVLSYSIIMLNTDQHNPNIKAQARMTLEDFCRNVRGVNDGANFDRQFLSDIYSAIRNFEIIVAEEHDTELSFFYIWSKLLQNCKNTTPFLRTDSNAFDYTVFNDVWNSILAALMYVFSTATEDTVFYRVVNGIQQVADVAAHFNQTNVIDYIVHRLTEFTAIGSMHIPEAQLNTAISHEDHQVVVSELSVRFGRDFRAQLALIVLFWVCNKFKNCMQDSWLSVVNLILALGSNNLLSKESLPGAKLFQYEHFPFPNPPLSSGKSNFNKEGGLLSTLSSYLSSYANDEPPAPSSDEIGQTLSSVECIRSSKIDEFLHNLVDLDGSTLERLIDALIEIGGGPLYDDASTQNETNGFISGSVNSSHAHYNTQTLIIADMLTSLFIGFSKKIDASSIKEKVLSYLLNKSEQIVDEQSMNHLSYYILLLYLDESLELEESSVEWKNLSKYFAVVKRKEFSVESSIISMFLELSNRYSYLLYSTFGFDLLDVLLHVNSADVSDLLVIFHKVSARKLDLPKLQTYVSFVDVFIQNIVKQLARILSRQKKGLTKGKPVDKTTLESHGKDLNDAFDLYLRVASEFEDEYYDVTDEKNVLHQKWKMLYSHICKFCLSRSRSLRTASFSCLQRVIMVQLDKPHDINVTMSLFHQALLPTMENMITTLNGKPEHHLFGLAKAQMFSIICKTILLDMNILSNQSKMLYPLWLKLMDVAIKLSAMHGSEAMAEVMESIKNVYLILHSAGALRGPTVDDTDSDPVLKTWNSTWNNLFIYYPVLAQELDLSPETETETEKPTEEHNSLETGVI